ncbi:MAG: hypothetical protein GY906_22600 [bacterium]|nr:hypothetical protein [bacterium]
MSTRCTTHFKHGKTLAAIIYRHTDGYPNGAGADLLGFFDECAKLKDSRLGDPTYLAAKYVVFLADQFNWDWQYEGDKAKKVRPESRLDFLSVGVMMADPGDEEYRYEVDCDNLVDGKPVTTCFRREGTWDAPEWKNLGPLPVTEDDEDDEDL